MAIRLFGRDAAWDANKANKNTTTNQTDERDLENAFQTKGYGLFNEIMDENVRNNGQAFQEDPSFPKLW